MAIIAECWPLSLDDDGRVWLEGDEYDPAEPIGRVETGGREWPEYAEQWAYLQTEWADAKRFRAGCDRAVEAAWRGRFDSRGW